jgi:hypothetical protein
MDMSEEPQDRHAAEFERRAREAFRTSVDDLDAATLSRLNQSRQKALAAVQGSSHGRNRWLTWAPAGALAAGVLAAVLLWRAPPDANAPPTVASSSPADTQQDPIELLAAGEDLDLATEADLDFYVWVELATADDGVG